MIVINSISDIQKYVSAVKLQNKTIGLVPTMGYLHQGHLSLVDASRKENDITIVSSFVNPIQFAPTEDLEKYPRDFERDKELLLDRGVDVLFTPNSSEFYPADFETQVVLSKLTKLIEGEFRPTHFDGVTTVVSIFFNLTSPNRAYFGQKDAQQAAIIKKMVKDLKYNIEIMVMPIVRDNDNLALSSRNVYLSPDERIEALALNKSLSFAESLVQHGELTCSKIISEMKLKYFSNKNLTVDYIRIVDEETFEEIEQLNYNRSYYILIAAKVGKTRLIDNIIISI